MDLTKMLLDQLGSGGIEEISKQVGMDSGKTTAAMGAIVPTLLGALTKNSASPEGASGLLGALDSDKHDGSILDNLSGFLGGGGAMSAGSGILKHMLGGQQSTVENGLAGKLGVDAGSISKLMAIAAPLIMSFLGKQKRSSGSSGFDAGGLGGLLGGMLGSSNERDNGLDLGDIMDMVGGLSGGSSSGGGGLLGGLLKGFMK